MEFWKYKKVLKENLISSLAARRTKLALNFAKMSLKNKRFKNWFVPTEDTKNNIFIRTKYKNVIANKKKNGKNSYIISNKTFKQLQ